MTQQNELDALKKQIRELHKQQERDAAELAALRSGQKESQTTDEAARVQAARAERAKALALAACDDALELWRTYEQQLMVPQSLLSRLRSRRNEAASL